MNTEIVVAIIGMISAVAVAVVSGVFSSRAYLKKQLSEAHKQATNSRKSSRNRAILTRKLISAICRVLFWVVFVLEKDVAQNGELDKLKEAMTKVESAENALKEIERDIVEE